jgi:hypothetical protein
MSDGSVRTARRSSLLTRFDQGCPTTANLSQIRFRGRTCCSRARSCLCAIRTSASSRAYATWHTASRFTLRIALHSASPAKSQKQAKPNTRAEAAHLGLRKSLRERPRVLPLQLPPQRAQLFRLRGLPALRRQRRVRQAALQPHDLPRPRRVRRLRLARQRARRRELALPRRAPSERRKAAFNGRPPTLAGPVGRGSPVAQQCAPPARPGGQGGPRRPSRGPPAHRTAPSERRAAPAAHSGWARHGSAAVRHHVSNGRGGG